MRTDPDLMNPHPTVASRIETGDKLFSSANLEALSLSLSSSSVIRTPVVAEYPRLSPDAKFHLRMAFTCALLLTISIAGCRLASIHVDIGSRIFAVVTTLAMIAPLPVYWHEKGRAALRESTLVLPWALIAAALLPFPVLIASRWNMPLQDTLFGHIDQTLGGSVPAIMDWAGHHWLGTIINACYRQLLPLLAIAALAPALTGKMKEAREFLVSSLIASIMALLFFAILPTVGPWYHYHLVPTIPQAVYWNLLHELQQPGPYTFREGAAGILCFPSFSVIWAILSASALWGFRPLRIPVSLLSALIILSTLTTGWYYLTDVIAGVFIAALAIGITRTIHPASQPVPSSQ